MYIARLQGQCKRCTYQLRLFSPWHLGCLLRCWQQLMAERVQAHVQGLQLPKRCELLPNAVLQPLEPLNPVWQIVKLLVLQQTAIPCGNTI